MRGRFISVCLLLIAFIVLFVNAEVDKRSAMGGSAFGSLDRIPIQYLKLYRSHGKRAVLNPTVYDSESSFFC
ncbi:hypothetical protein WR25_19489 [Diploscapter pachys]|uniref:Transmembrane protein n=1 Tax=Diploscapter pachys TaxID=2018661 RepID=A0A2A2K0J7_9BILA|nr:hypothetical protein WR25_19489 [Diploscapter pachys]